MSEFVIPIMETVLECFNKGPKEEQNLKRVLICLSDLFESIPTEMSKHFDDLFILVGKIAENGKLENATKEIGLDFIVKVAEKKPKIIKKDK